MREIRVGSIQPLGMAHLAPFQGERDRGLARQRMDANIDQACRLLSQAGEAGFDIVCYPEDIQGTPTTATFSMTWNCSRGS